jgi:hypothetical protein
VSDGLVVPVNAPPGQSTPIGVQPGVSSAITFANTLVVFGSASGPFTGGVFVYQPGTTPGPGNPPIFSVTAGTVDPFGNPVIPTVEIAAGGQLNAGNTIVNTAGIFTYSAFPPAANTLIASTAPAAGTDAVGNAYLEGTFVYAKGISNWTATGVQSTANTSQFVTYYTTGLAETGWILGAQFQAVAGVAVPSGAPMQYLANGQGLLIGTGPIPEQIELSGSIEFASQTGTPSNTAGNCALFANANAALAVEDTANLVRSVVRSVGSATALSAGNNTTSTALSQVFSIAPDLASGSMVEIHVPFIGSMGAAAEVFGLGYSLNGGAAVNIATLGTTIAPVNTAFGGNVHLFMKIAAVGAGGTCRLWLEGSGIQSGVNINLTDTFNITGNVLTGVAINTTVTNTLALFGNWGGAGGAAQVFTGEGSTLKIYP